MQFPNMDEEDGDFAVGAVGRSRLSSLFQNESSSGDVNQALTFTAPKQPRKNDGAAQSEAGTLKLIHAAFVHTYKLIEGKYVNQGKLGCAILGLHETSTYKILLYKGKQVQVTLCTVTSNFVFHVQPSNYASIYDDKKENWSLNFDSEASFTEFSKQIALAKANSQGKSSNSLVIQDLVVGEGPCLELNDSAEVKYTGWLLQNFTVGQMFDSNMSSETNFRIRLGKSKVIKGWNEGLYGCQKGSKRFLIIPPNLAYGAEGMTNAVPPNSTLIFFIHVVKVKVSREASHSPSPVKVADNLAEKKPDVPPRHSFSQEDNIRMRGASISEQLSQSPKKDKAQLISRMAKMGTATLPLQGAIPAQASSESENEDEVSADPPAVASLGSSRTSSPKAFSKPRSRNSSGNSNAASTNAASTNAASANAASANFASTNAPAMLPVQPQPVPGNAPFHVSQHSSQVSLYSQAPMPFQQPFMQSPASSFPSQVPGQFAVPQSQYALQNIPGMAHPIATSMADAHLPLLISEARSQNSEIRLSLAKIADKVDGVSQKVDDLRLQGRTPSSSHVPFMESAIVIQNIERIVQENNRLKEDMEAKNNKIQALNEKICDLFQRNQRFFEESSSMLEQRSDSLQAASAQSHAKFLTLEQEKLKLSFELSEATLNLASLEGALQKHQCKESELQQKIAELENECKRQENLLSGSKEHLNEGEAAMNALKDELKNVQHGKRLLTMKLESLEVKFSELQETKESLEKNLEENQRKFEEIKSKAERELTELRRSHEKEIETYEEKLKQKSSKSNLESFSTAQNSDELTNLKKEMEQILKERDEMHLKGQDLHKKLQEFERNEASHKENLQELQAELEKSLLWKKKYEVFYEKTKALKDRYENQIVELMTEVKQLQAVRSVAPSSDFSSEIKRVMNMLYKLLQGKFDANASYSGSKVLEMALQAIRGLTLQMLEVKQRSADSSEKVGDCGNTASLQQNPNISKSLPESEEGNRDDVLRQNGVNESKVSDGADGGWVANSLSESDAHAAGVPANPEPEATRVQNERVENGLLEDLNSDGTGPIQTNPAILDASNKLMDGANSVIESTEAKKMEIEKRASPERLAPRVPPELCRRLARDAFFAILFAYVLFWIGAWVHELEATATPSL